MKIRLALISLSVLCVSTGFAQKLYYQDSSMTTDYGYDRYSLFVSTSDTSFRSLPLRQPASHMVGPASIQCIWVNGPHAKKQYQELRALVHCGSKEFVGSKLTETIEDYSIDIQTELKPQFTRLGFTFPARHIDTVLSLLKAIVYQPKHNVECEDNWKKEVEQKAAYYSNFPDTILARSINKQYWNAHAPNLDFEAPYKYQLGVNERLHFSVAMGLPADSFLKKCPWFTPGKSIAFEPLANRKVSELNFIGPEKMMQTMALVFEIPNGRPGGDYNGFTSYEVCMQNIVSTTFMPPLFAFTDSARRANELAIHHLDTETDQFVLYVKTDNWLKKKAEIDVLLNEHAIMVDGQLESTHGSMASYHLMQCEHNDFRARQVVLIANRYPYLFETQVYSHYPRFSTNGLKYSVFVYGASN